MTPADSNGSREQQELLSRAARDFIEERFTRERRLEADLEGDDGVDLEAWQALAGMQWTGTLIPEAYGGVGGGLEDAATIYEEMGRQLVPGPHLSCAVLAAQILQEGGTEEQKLEYLGAIARGARVIVPAISEEQDDWTADNVQLRATPAGDGYRLDGLKLYVPDAAVADVLIVAARAAEGVTLFLVDANAAGVTTRRMSGWTAQPLFEIRLEGVTVPASAVIGSVGEGWDVLEPALRVGAVVLCSYMIGAAERVYEMTIDYSHQRVQFGQSISRFQRVADRVIEQRNLIDAARLTTQEALDLLARDDPEAAKYVSVAKALTSQGFYLTCEEAHHVHAGIGSTKEFGLYLYTQASHSLYHYLGSPDVHEERVGALLAAE